jgi:hypothetical protein
MDFEWMSGRDTGVEAVSRIQHSASNIQNYAKRRGSQELKNTALKNYKF